ncbi:hypothetical protein KUL156_18520 [Alteromonas sp. KUL156]|nr:hypothetical protein KUL154_44980 [Alteromonas sp. KUL154]GFD99259.1 hypothetical protein KUL156_18520 [Alteromonas sp. KUL156]
MGNDVCYSNLDLAAIEVASLSIRFLLKLDSLQPDDVIGLGQALKVLESFPDLVEKTAVEVSISLRTGDSNVNEMSYIGFNVRHSDLTIQRGGHNYSKEIGGDSYSEPNVFVDFFCEDTTNDFDVDEVSSILENVKELVEHGAEVNITYS